MIRKIVGFVSIMALALAFAGCGGSSTGSSEDECTKDPNALGCDVNQNDGLDVLTDGTEP